MRGAAFALLRCHTDLPTGSASSHDTALFATVFGFATEAGRIGRGELVSVIRGDGADRGFVANGGWPGLEQCRSQGRIAAMIGRTVMATERASANYFLRQVRRRRTGEVSWEIVDATSGVTVVAGFESRDDALRLVRGWERLSQELDEGLEGHILVH